MTPATTPAGPPLPRDRFPVASRLAYLDTAYMSPLPGPVTEAMAADGRRVAERGSRCAEEREADAHEVRAAAAALMGTDPDDVALVANTTQGIGLVAAGLDWRPGDRAVVAAGDHPAVVAPFRARADVGVQVVEVPTGPGAALPLDRLDATLADAGGRARVVAVSWVRADRGARADLAAVAEVAHAHGALLCVDLIQGLGAIPCDLVGWGVDAAAAGAQKWLLGPHGVGVAHLSPAVRDRLRVLAPSHHGLGPGAGPPTYGPTARRHESGSPDHAGLAGLRAALALHQQAGTSAVWAAVDGLATRLASGLAALGGEVSSVRGDGATGSGIVSVRLPGIDAEDVVARLAAADVVVAARAGEVRLSAHAWNDTTDLDAALAAVAAL